MKPRFRDRVDAGQQLSQALQGYESSRPLILGLARGGVVLAGEIARTLHADLDVLIARKVGARGQPEFGIGAVAPGGIQVANDRALAMLHISSDDFRQLAAREELEVKRRLREYRGNRPLQLAGRSVIIVDDGLATGVTAQAAVRYARSQNPEKLVLAVPICTHQARKLLELEVDELVFLHEPEPFYSVGQFYEDFAQVDDDEVIRLLREANND